MARTSLIAATAAAALLAAPALAQEPQCQNRLDTLSSDYRDVIEDRANPSAQVVLRGMRDSARRLEAQSLHEACLEVLDAMEVALAAYRDSGPGAASAIVPTPELGNIDTRTVALSEAGIDTSRMQGGDVYTYTNEYLGEIDGVLVNAGRPTHVVVGRGGFWDRGPGEVAIPADMLRWDPEWRAFFVSISAEDAGEAPAYSADGAEWNTQENDGYYRNLTSN